MPDTYARAHARMTAVIFCATVLCGLLGFHILGGMNREPVVIEHGADLLASWAANAEVDEIHR